MDKPRIERDALNALLHYSYPGNVRELENILERAVALCDENRIGADEIHLPDTVPDTTTAGSALPLEEYLEQVEREAINRALEATRWNRTAAAKKLGISFRQLRYRLNKLGID